MELSHVRQGSGPPLLLVHGIGHSLDCWRQVTPALAASHEVFAIDLPGFGDSPALGAAPTLEALTHACVAFMAAHGHERFHVAGNSLGGGIALALALGGRALSACALSPVGFVAGAAERANLQLTLLASRELAPAMVRALPVLRPPGPVRRVLHLSYAAHADRISLQALIDTYEKLAAAPGFQATRRHAINWRAPSVGHLPVPVTIAWGDKDRLLLHRPQSARARERWPAATHVTLTDCGHLPTWDDPGLIARTIAGTTAAAPTVDAAGTAA
jgi:pimeloyl-ACP methyl ester carboxylesterase